MTVSGVASTFLAASAICSQCAVLHSKDSTQVVEKHVSELDLGCETYKDGVDWIDIREKIKAFLRAPNEAHNFTNDLVMVGKSKPTTDCYIGLCAVGYFSLLFADPKKRDTAFTKSLFGSVPMNVQIPLSYWDTIGSGWPIFGLLDLLSMDVKGEGAKGPDVTDGCCDRIESEADRKFFQNVWHHLGAGTLVPAPVILKYLAESPIRCSWGKASAYFALSERFLHAKSPLMTQAAKEAMALGESQLDRCTSGRNATVHEQMFSAWPSWSFLRRIEADALVKTPSQFLRTPPGYKAPSLLGAPRSHWKPVLGSVHDRIFGHATKKLTAVVDEHVHDAEVVLSPQDSGDNLPMTRRCDALSRDVHVALAGDKRHAEGVLAVIYSTSSSTKSPHRVCIHLFCSEAEASFYRQALRCSFQKAVAEETGGKDFILAGVAIRLEVFDPEQVLTQDFAVDVGVLTEAGDLNTPHNFIRFRLERWLHPEKISRIVYLDTDVIVLGDVCNLHDDAFQQGGDVALAAVPRPHLPLSYYLKALSPKMPMWLPSSVPSFNAGVMVIDNRAWRRANITGAVDELKKFNVRRDLWRHGSQPLLLLLLHDRVQWLDGSWNVDGLGHRTERSDKAIAGAKILHWTGPLKPWLAGGLHRELWAPFGKHCW